MSTTSTYKILKYLQNNECNTFYIGTEHEYLKHKYIRPELVPCKEKLLDVPKSIKKKKTLLLDRQLV